MFRGVPVLRGVAAANVTADEALAQVHPGVAGFHALLAALGVAGVRAGDELGLIEVWAGRHKVFASGGVPDRAEVGVVGIHSFNVV